MTSYRQPPDHRACPRCASRLVLETVGERDCLRCTSCAGLFLPSEVLAALVEPQNSELREAFSDSTSRVDEGPVRYLNCPVCKTIMNRRLFGRGSGITVDICAKDGTWFDGGELALAIEYVASGAFERSQHEQAAQRKQENEQLRATWRSEHEASQQAGSFNALNRRRRLTLSAGERYALSGFVSWLRGRG